MLKLDYRDVSSSSWSYKFENADSESVIEINLLLQSAFISGYVQLMSKNMQGSDQITPLKQLAQGTTFFRLLSKVQLGLFREKAHVD